MSDWNEFRMSASMESVMIGYQDPRLPVYWLPDGATDTNPGGNGKYDGLRNGLTSTQLTQSVNAPTANAKAGKRWSSPSFAGNANYLATPQNVMCAAEAYFLRAEGALLGWNMGGTAQELYQGGITNSMKQWGITDAAAIEAYINSTNTPIAPNDYLNSPPVSDAPVKFAADLKQKNCRLRYRNGLLCSLMVMRHGPTIEEAVLSYYIPLLIQIILILPTQLLNGYEEFHSCFQNTQNNKTCS